MLDLSSKRYPFPYSMLLVCPIYQFFPSFHTLLFAGMVWYGVRWHDFLKMEWYVAHFIVYASSSLFGDTYEQKKEEENREATRDRSHSQTMKKS